MLRIPPEITRINNADLRAKARCRFVWDSVKRLSGSETWPDLSAKLGYKPRCAATLRQRGVISGNTARRMQAACGQDKRGRWIAPKEIIAPHVFGDE